MRARGHNRARRADIVRVNIIHRQTHIGTVLAIENQRELLLIADAQQHQGRQTLGVGLDPRHIHALALQLLTDEPAHVLIPDARDQTGLQTQPRRPAGNVRRGPTDVLLKGPHILQAPTNLRPIQINRRTPNRNQIKCGHSQKPVCLRKVRDAARSSRIEPAFCGSRSCSMVI